MKIEDKKSKVLLMFRDCLEIAMTNRLRVDVISLKEFTEMFDVGNNVKNLFCNFQATFIWSPRHLIRYCCPEFTET